jgi:hypothetical protein
MDGRWMVGASLLDGWRFYIRRQWQPGISNQLEFNTDYYTLINMNPVSCKQDIV